MDGARRNESRSNDMNGSEDKMENGAYEDIDNEEHCEPNETNAFIQSELSDDDSVQRGKVCARVVQKVERG